MKKFVISLIFHGLLTIALIWIVFSFTVSGDPLRSFTLSLSFVPVIFFIVIIFANYLVFKRIGVSTKHVPNIIISDDEREQQIINDTALFAFHNIAPFITAIGFVIIIFGFGINIQVGLDVDGVSLLRWVGTTMVLLLSLPSFIHTLMVIFKIRHVV